MRILTADSAAQFDCLAAELVQSQLSAAPGAVLALPTGSTPLGLYALLRQHAAPLLRTGRYLNLDEYLGWSPAHPLSYARFLMTHLLTPAGVPCGQIELLLGDAPDPQQECVRYDALLRAWGGIDLAILGLGANGHIAFNEPGTAWDTRTHVAPLAPDTREANARLMPDTPVPRFGLTMGIATLREARTVLLLVSGSAKAQALARLLAATPDPQWPATSLHDHRRLTVLCAPELAPVVTARASRNSYSACAPQVSS